MTEEEVRRIIREEMEAHERRKIPAAVHQPYSVHPRASHCAYGEPICWSMHRCVNCSQNWNRVA